MKMTVDQRTPIRRADGITAAERYLKRLSDRTFLSLWSYAGVYRDQGTGDQNRQGKELCDLLVVFDRHVIIFSDKDCQFPNSGNLELDWSRWFRRAVMKPAEQIWGAERWIRLHPHRLFLDRACTQPLPISLPEPATAKFHRIVVSHSVSRRCQEELGGSGSLVIRPNIVGDKHWASLKDGGMPFAIGQLAPDKGYVHVFDDISLEVVLRTLDTITDFVSYLAKKEKFVGSGKLTVAAGEDDLLAFYLGHLNDEGEHDFAIPPEYNGVWIDEGFWNDFVQSPERQAQIAANQVSYSWDALIETFNKHILENTQYYTTHPGIEASERIIRFLAREPRTRRRLLAKSLLGFIYKTPVSQRAIRVMLPSHEGDPYYVFLLLPHLSGVPYSEYREVRLKLLEACCVVTKLAFPDAQDIIGIATETGQGEPRSEDSLYFDARVWTEKDQAEAEDLQNTLGLLTNTSMFRSTEKEYPLK